MDRVATGLIVARRAGQTRALDVVMGLTEALVVLALAADLAITFANTVARYVFNGGIAWIPDASAICLTMMTFLGAAAYLRRGGGMAYTAVVDFFPGFWGDALRAFGLCATLAVCLGSLFAFPAFLQSALYRTLPVLDITEAVVVVWQGIGLALMAACTAEKLLAVPRRGLVVALAATAVLGALLALLRHTYFNTDLALDPLIPVGAVMIVAFVTATPIAFILAAGGILFFVLTGEAPMVAVPAAYQGGIGSFVLLAIPFFMVAGTLMEITGMARRMIDMVQAFIGHWRGGLLIAEVVAMYIFSGMSGSKAADIATVGSVMKAPLRRGGYAPTESVAVLAAAAAMGEVVPPSLALLILGSITTLSVGALFVAGIVPAAVLAVALILAIRFRGRGGRFPSGAPFRWRTALASVAPAVPALMVPVIVVGGIVVGIAAPTEASSFAVIYGLLAASLVYRSLDWRGAWPPVRDAALTSGMVLFMVAAANVLSQAIVIDGLGRLLAAAFADIQNRTAFLFLSMAALVVIGFVLEGFPAILITAPILLPVAEQMGVDPLQYGILLVMAIGLGVFMPPVGIGYYVACAIGDAPPGATMRPSLTYNLFLALGLIVATLVPQITLVLPHLFGLG